MIFRKSITTLFILALMVSVFVGCDDRNSTDGTYTVKILVPEDLGDREYITIYADNNITVATIQAQVSDKEGNAPMGIPVTFRTDIGSIINLVETDSSGIARATLKDQGYKGLAKVTAEVQGGAKSSIFVDIIEAPSVDTIGVNIVNALSVSRTTEISAYPKDADGENIQDGTIVTFKTDLGNYQAADGTDSGQSIDVTTSNGVAKAIYNAGKKSGEAKVTISVGEKTIADTIQIAPGNPNKINLSTLHRLTGESISTLLLDGDHTLKSCNVIAEVLDRYDNPVTSGVNVEFEAYRIEDENDEETKISMGSITEMVPTDDNGVAENRFRVGTQAGVVTIEATADSANVKTAMTINASKLSSMQFDFQDQVDLNIRGTGGVEQFELIVNLFDTYGNALDVTDTVYFRFAGDEDGIPTGAKIGRNCTSWNSYQEVEANNGQARVTVSSGSGSGTVNIEVSDKPVRADADAITATKSNIVINGGMPANIDIEIGDFNSGSNLGGGLWEIEVAANVTDQFGNPVALGTAVWFSVNTYIPDYNNPVNEPDFNPDYVPMYPDWAVIGAGGFIGNTNAEDDSTAGVAYTTLVYDGTYANQWLNIVTECGSVRDTASFKMPMNEPQLTMYPQRGHVDFGGPHADVVDDDSVSTGIVVEVSDQQGNYVKDAVLSLWSDRGSFQFIVDGNGERPYKVFNSNDPRYVKTLVTGRSMAKIWFGLVECPAPQNGIPGEQNVQVNAQIEGTDIQNNTNVLIIRHR